LAKHNVWILIRLSFGAMQKTEDFLHFIHHAQMKKIGAAQASIAL
jgi:hypothetical protein